MWCVSAQEIVNCWRSRWCCSPYWVCNPPKNDFVGVNRHFKPNTQIIYKLAYYCRNYCTESSQILQSDKNHQILFVGGPNMRNKSKMADKAYWSSEPRSHLTFHSFENPRRRTTAILKNRIIAISPHIRLTDRHEIWQGDDVTYPLVKILWSHHSCTVRKLFLNGLTVRSARVEQLYNVLTPTANLTGGKRILTKGRTAILSPLSAANGCVRPWPHLGPTRVIPHQKLPMIFNWADSPKIVHPFGDLDPHIINTWFSGPITRLSRFRRFDKRDQQIDKHTHTQRPTNRPTTALHL